MEEDLTEARLMLLNEQVTRNHTGSGGLKVGNFLKMLTCELDGVRSREMPG